MENIRERITELRTILKFMREIALKYRDDAQAAASARDELQKSGVEKSEQIQRLEIALGQLQNQLRELEASKSALEARARSLEQVNSDLKEKNSSLSNSYATLRAELNQRYEVIQSFARIEDLRELDGELQKRIAENQKLGRELNEERAKLEEDRQELSNAQKEFADKEQEFADRQERYAEENKDFERERQEIVRREEAAKSKELDNVNEEKRLKAWEERLKKDDEELDKKRDDLDVREKNLDQEKSEFVKDKNEFERKRKFTENLHEKAVPSPTADAGSEEKPLTGTDYSRFRAPQGQQKEQDFQYSSKADKPSSEKIQEEEIFDEYQTGISDSNLCHHQPNYKLDETWQNAGNNKPKFQDLHDKRVDENPFND